MFDISVFFFFSSRRRHTRSLRGWSSDVCSSDLTWGRLASEALPTGCSWHDQAGSERRGGRRRRSARQRGLARYLGPGIAICLATPRKLWARRMAGVVAWLDIQNCAKASPSSREIALDRSPDHEEREECDEGWTTWQTVCREAFVPVSGDGEWQPWCAPPV